MLTLAPAELKKAVLAAFDAGFFAEPIPPDTYEYDGFMKIPRWAKIRFEELTGFWPSDSLIAWPWDRPLRAPIVPTEMGRDEQHNRRVVELIAFLWRSFLEAIGDPVIDWTEVKTF